MEISDIRKIIEVPGYLVEGGSILDLIDVEEIAASQPVSKGYLFVAVRLKNGKAAAIWESHAAIGESLDVLSFGSEELGKERDPVLNNHEKSLIIYGSGK